MVSKARPRYTVPTLTLKQGDELASALQLRLHALNDLALTLAGTPGAIVKGRTWNDYSLGRASTIAHLGALDEVYEGVVSDHRKAAEFASEIDMVSEDMLVGHLRSLELFQWFVRAHLENEGGVLSTAGAESEKQAAEAAEKAAKTAP